MRDTTKMSHDVRPTLPPDPRDLEDIAGFERQIAELGEEQARLHRLLEVIRAFLEADPMQEVMHGAR